MVNANDCRNQCGTKIYFDDKVKSQSGKSIPLEIAADGSPSGKPHNCPLSKYSIARGKKDSELGKPIYQVIKELQDKLKLFEERLTKVELSRWSFYEDNKK